MTAETSPGSARPYSPDPSIDLPVPGPNGPCGSPGRAAWGPLGRLAISAPAQSEWVLDSPTSTAMMSADCPTETRVLECLR